MVMGSVISNYRSIYLHKPELVQYRVEFEILKLDQYTVNKLYKAYQQIKPIPSNRVISCAEFLAFLEVERNHFTDLIFRAMDKDDNKTLDFREFVISLWNYCTLGEEALSESIKSIISP
jgi:Ca2+-binding EF-hand superfamily protein